jgi:hypothetical protein
MKLAAVGAFLMPGRDLPGSVITSSNACGRHACMHVWLKFDPVSHHMHCVLAYFCAAALHAADGLVWGTRASCATTLAILC